jgi:hypothetical protein
MKSINTSGFSYIVGWKMGLQVCHLLYMVCQHSCFSLQWFVAVWVKAELISEAVYIFCNLGISIGPGTVTAGENRMWGNLVHFCWGLLKITAGSAGHICSCMKCHSQLLLVLDFGRIVLPSVPVGVGGLVLASVSVGAGGIILAYSCVAVKAPTYRPSLGQIEQILAIGTPICCHCLSHFVGLLSGWCTHLILIGRYWCSGYLMAGR